MLLSFHFSITIEESGLTISYPQYDNQLRKFQNVDFVNIILYYSCDDALLLDKSLHYVQHRSKCYIYNEVHNLL